MTEAAAVRASDQLDWVALEARLRDALDVPAAPMEVRQFTAGRANLTYLVTFGEAPLVVRRPPRGTIAPGAHDMEREHRVLSRLTDRYPRAPRALYFDDDESVIGAPFVVTEYREGVIVSAEIPPSLARHSDAATRIDQALLDAAADLHAVDAAAAGLGDLGRPDGFAQRQLDGWRDRWHRAAPADAPASMDRVAAQLAASVPEPQRASLVHNDLKLDNCQLQPDDPDQITSVFDWDMVTRGDPLFDLGLLLESMRTMPAWVLSADEAVGYYAERSGLDVDGIGWYRAFAAWRTAVVLQQLYNRYLAGLTTDERYIGFGAAIEDCAERARSLVA